LFKSRALSLGFSILVFVVSCDYPSLHPSKSAHVFLKKITMRFFTTFVASASVLASVVSAAQHNVVVGDANTNIFEPKFLEGVASGDTIAFKFFSKNHTVTQSTFAAPCVNNTNGVDSGFMPVDAANATKPEWTIRIDNVTAPLWFYCAQGAHCKAGMVFAINPTAEKTYDAFLASAKGVAPTSTAPSGGSQTSSTAAGASSTSTSNSGGVPNISVQKLTSFLAALGLIASLTL
jgi:preprotein translocase subunit SecG